MSFLSKSDTQKWEIMVLKTSLIATETKKSTRDFLTNKGNLNLLTGTLLFGFPIIFYVSCLGDNKKSELNGFIQTTLPGLAKQKNYTSWETFQKTNYLPIPKSSANISLQTSLENPQNAISDDFQESIYKNAISNLEIWGQSLVFQLNNNWKSYKKQYFFGLKMQSTELASDKYFIYPSREKIDSGSYRNIYSSEKPHLSNLKFYHLDEYPIKLQSFQREKNYTQLPIQVKKTSSLNVISTSNSKEVLKKTDININQLIAIKNNSNSTLKSKHNERVAFNKLKQDITSDLTKFNQTQLKWQYITAKIKEIQTRTNYNLVINDISHLLKPDSVKLLNNNYGLLASHQLLNLLEKNLLPDTPITAQQLSYTNFLNRPPLMSGFAYPDLPKQALLNYNLVSPNILFKPSLQNFDKQLSIYLGSHFTYPEFHWNKKINPLPFYFHSHPVTFELINGKISYKGQGTILNDTYKTSSYLSNDYLLKNQKNLKAILNEADPRGSQLTYSFSKVLNESKLKNQNNKLFKQTYKNAQEIVLLKNYSSLKPLSQERFSQTPLFNYKSEFIVPYLSPQDWQAWSSKKTSGSKTQTGLIQGFPLRQIQFLVNSDSKLSYDVLDYQNPAWIFKSLNTNIFNYEDFMTQSSFSKSINVGKYQNIFYQNKRDLYNSDPTELRSLEKNINQLNESLKLDSKVFREVWEPIHQNSWLTINKFLFALLIVYILKQFIREYGKELVSYLVDLFASIGIVDDSLKEELAPQTLSKTYRLIKKNKKDFKNITGINHIFTDVAELVWFLRNLGRPFRLGDLVPKGLLLVGAPGTGKTLLVQAIAGEAEVPVLVQSASTLHRLEGRGPQKLKTLFEKARELGPCIIFFDELDSIGEKRSKIIENPIDRTTLLSMLYWNGKQKYQTYDYGIPFSKKKTKFDAKKLSTPLSEGITRDTSSNSQEQSPEQLGLLMQLLIELDGLQVNRNLVVIGATNRPEILDPALTRPGRLSKMLEIGLPNKESRISICQLYSRFLGVSTNICWNTIAEETTGLSGADLATIMNQSSIQAILLGTRHTQETINVAIDKVLGSGPSKYSRVSISNLFLDQDLTLENYNLQKHFLACSAYNEAGLKLLEYFLPNHKNPIVAKLVSTAKNSRYKNQDLDYFIKTQQYATQYKIQFRTKILALLGGKAAEFLFLQRSKLIERNNFHKLLNLGTNQLRNVSNLIYFTISKEAFFPTYSPFLKFNLTNNQNHIEHIDIEMVDLFTNLANNYEKDLLGIEFSKYRNFQRWTTKSWWQVQVSNLDKVKNSKKSSWYRLFVMHPDNSTPSNERLAADNYFHGNHAYFLTRTLTFNDQFNKRRELLYKNILDSSFRLTTLLLNSNRELLDLLVVSLIQRHSLTQLELENLFSNFDLNLKSQSIDETKITYLNQLEKNSILFN